MPEKLKELLDNKWFWIFILLMFAAVTAGRVTRCSRDKGRVQAAAASRAHWSKLLLIMDYIEDNYVDSVSCEDLTEDAISSVLQNLDPHSVYLPPMDLEKADETLVGNFSGIGIEFNVPNDTAVIVNVIPGGPSQRAGLMSGDRIVKVDGRNVAGVQFPQDSLMKILRGPKDSKVCVSVKRRGEKELLPFDIKRGMIPVHSLDAAIMLTPALGYIKLSTFSATTYREFMEAAARLKQQGMTSLLLDLRENPGGFLDQAYRLANEFLERGDMVVYMEGRRRPREEFQATGRGNLKDIKLYVAIDENSASSSEIMAGAIQDNDRGIIIGRRSFGKGLVQEPVYFSDSSGIRLTVARYYTPSGRCIQKPYTSDYHYDILERYQRGEMQSADSIRVNDSLKYTTVHGNTVYGGGGIIPDVFIPIDTTGVTDFLVKVNRRSLQMKFSSMFADKHRDELQAITTIEGLEELYRKEDIGRQFQLFAASEGVRALPGEWEQSGSIIVLQIKGLIGRYSSMKDDAFYPYVLKTDSLAEKVKELENN